MKCLLFGGAESVGKSKAIYRLAKRLITPPATGATSPFSTFKDVHGSVPASFADFHAVLEGKNNKGEDIRIIINSPTDTKAIINKFKKFYDSNGTYDILISSVKEDSYPVRSYFFKTMSISPSKNFILEIPLAKVRRGVIRAVSLNWYEKNLDGLVEHVLNRDPYNL